MSSKDHFSNDLDCILKKELTANRKLMKLRRDLFNSDKTIITGNYYSKL
jgi:hypothetical protein